MSESDLELLVGQYMITDQQRSRLVALAGRTQRQAWWEPYTDALTDPYEAYIAAEAQAVAISAYEAQIVPGLLQTVEYAHAVIQADSSLRDPDSINQRVQVRMARTAVLMKEPRPVLQVVIDEAVLRRPIGGAELFKRQMLRLVEASQRPNVTLRVLPFAVGAHQALAGSFTILDLPDGATALIYSEGLTGGVMRDDEADVRVYRDSFEAICAASLPPDESREALSAIASA